MDGKQDVRTFSGRVTIDVRAAYLVIAFERGESMARQLEAAGGTVRFTAYPEAGHGCWTETYQNPALYAWMLNQEKRGEKARPGIHRTSARARRPGSCRSRR